MIKNSLTNILLTSICNQTGLKLDRGLEDVNKKTLRRLLGYKVNPLGEKDV